MTVGGTAAGAEAVRPRRRPRFRDETGSASVEFLATGLLLILPLVYLVLMVSAVHAAALAGEGAARQGARLYATARDAHDARARLADAVDLALADQGLSSDDASVRVHCVPADQPCPSPGGRVSVTVTVRVPLPLAPPILGLDAPTSVPIDSSAVQPVSRFAGSG